jgi:hypothetical protein
MHPLMLDFYNFYSVKTGKPIAKPKDLFEVSGKRARKAMDDVGFANALYSLGIESPGAVVLHNYPKFLQELQMDDEVQPDGSVKPGRTLDLAAVDILRDRERGVPRYNDFRESVGRTRVKTFAEITSNVKWQKELKEVYGDVNKVDLMTGVFAEDFPKEFGFSDTSFRLFNLMAPRRLRSDRFYTDSYTEDVYTDWGISHVEETTMVDVILRHYPELKKALKGIDNGFVPWNKV